MRRGPAAGMVAALAGLALAGCGSSQTQSESRTGGARTRPAVTARTCAGSQLAAAFAGTEGATGHLELTLALRNVSRAPCRLRGYPTARLLDGAGHPLPMRVARGHGFFPDTAARPRSVALAPGHSAHFGISFVTNSEFKGARVCRTARTAMSAAPGSAGRWQRVSLRRAPRIAPCGDRLVISPVHL